jgi:hypothetical protein
VAGSQNGNVKFAKRPIEILKVHVSNDIATISGMPALRNIKVEVDLTRNALTMNGWVFLGEPYETKRVLWQDKEAKGVIFKREYGPISVTLVVLNQPDGSLLFSMEKIYVYGKELYKAYSAKPLADESAQRK